MTCGCKRLEKYSILHCACKCEIEPDFSNMEYDINYVMIQGEDEKGKPLFENGEPIMIPMKIEDVK